MLGKKWVIFLCVVLIILTCLPVPAFAGVLEDIRDLVEILAGWGLGWVEDKIDRIALLLLDALFAVIGWIIGLFITIFYWIFKIFMCLRA